MEVFAHLPHAQDEVPSDFHLFWPLKDELRGHNFRSEEDLIRQCTRGGFSDQRLLLLRNLCLIELLKEM